MTKTCSQCQITKPVEEFHRRLSGWQPRCKTCYAVFHREYHRANASNRIAKQQERYWADPEPKKAQQRGRYDPDKRKDYGLRKAYGITLDEFNRLVSEQKGICAICQLEPGQKGLAVDHCHDSGEIRGLLCGRCNTAIGLLRDDPQLLGAAISYLRGQTA